MAQTRVKMYVRLNRGCQKRLSADLPAKTENRAHEIHGPVVSHVFRNCVYVCYVFYTSGGIFFHPNFIGVLVVFFVHYSIIATMCSYIIVFARAFNYNEQFVKR